MCGLGISLPPTSVKSVPFWTPKICTDVENHVSSMKSLRKNVNVQISVSGTDFPWYRFLLPPSPLIFLPAVPRPHITFGSP